VIQWYTLARSLSDSLVGLWRLRFCDLDLLVGCGSIVGRRLVLRDIGEVLSNELSVAKTISLLRCVLQRYQRTRKRCDPCYSKRRIRPFLSARRRIEFEIPFWHGEKGKVLTLDPFSLSRYLRTSSSATWVASSMG
jgi:hypothetical protein